jgi:hypothetical protein
MSREIVRLTEQERRLLVDHYTFYKSLADGSRTPTTPAQCHFVAVCRGQASADTEHELAWQNFRRLMSLTHVPERQVVDRGFRLEVVVGNVPSEPQSEPLADPTPAPTSEPSLGDMTEYGEGIPAPGWFTDEGWRRLRAGYRYDSH